MTDQQAKKQANQQADIATAVNILLVDEQPVSLDSLAALLRGLLAEHGGAVIAVASREAAVRAAALHALAVIVLNVHAPAPGGMATAAVLRADPHMQAVPIIFLLGDDVADFPVEQAYALGAVDYVSKPCNPVVLRARVAVLLDLHRKALALAAHREVRYRADLRLRDERIGLILDSARDYAFIGMDADGIITEWEGGAADIVGAAGEQARGHSVAMIFSAQDRADGIPQQEMARALASGRALDKRWHVRANGERFYADGVLVPMRDDGGTLRGFAKIFRDATVERLAAEQIDRIEAERERLFAAVEAASEQLVDIFQRAPAFMCVVRGAAHRFEFVNQCFAELVGQRELQEREARAALPELAGQDFFEQLDAVYADGQPRERYAERLLLRRQRGKLLEPRYVDVVYTAMREADGAISGVLVHGIDVTERTQASLLALGQRSALELAVSDAPLGDVLDVLAHTAEDYAGGAGLAAIRLADGERARPRLRHVAAPSLSADFLDALDGLEPAADSGPGSLAAATGETVTVDDIDGDPRWPGFRALARVHGLRACRVMPILAPSGAVLGVFCWYYRELRAPNDDEHAALAMLANTASLVIGQRHEAAQRMAAEARSHNILESISEGFIAVDARWRITFANRAMEGVTALAQAALIGLDFWPAFSHMAGGVIEQGVRRCASERVAVKFDAWYDPRGGWFEINCYPTPDGGIALYFRDETERRMAQEGIRRLAAVAEQSPDFIGITSPDTVGMFLNPAGRRLSGMADDARMSDYRLVDFFAPDCRDQLEHEVLPALTGAIGRWEGELRFARLDSGAVVPVYFKGFAVVDERGAIIGLATVTRDITEQKRAEDALHRVAADLSEADHRKSEFLATLAHELRNPLAPIRSGLDLLRLKDGDSAMRARVTGMMDRQLGHLIHLVDDLLDVARITRGKIELKKAPVALHTLVAMALESNSAMIDALGHTLSVKVPEQPIVLDVDSTRVVQVLSNLINNAAKYTPPGGRISIDAFEQSGSDGAQAVVTVRDSGVGIGADALASVFDLFTQVRSHRELAQGGLGIGLSLVRRLVELHGGSVQAASEGRGEGSTFTVRLPLGGAAPLASTPHAASGAGSALRVLVVDDNADAADSLAALLELMGHHSRVAFDGRAGLALAQSMQPDLVILDIGMPGMNGHEVARAIRASAGLEQVLLVALTGWGAPADVALAVSAGFDHHLTKPVSIEALERALLARA
ncbi:PAS domain-containing protein [Massilia sp. PWRC2]|uniref:PAS domain-containing protein n=1 Tax=Massilia sp. PWRC2 TaxID=2804626 RepID=UPI003CE91271